MKAVVADTGPVNYLLLIGEINLLPCLFDEVLIPIEVHQELLNQNAPEVVRTWAANLPGWCSVKTASREDRPELLALDIGERAAIELALQSGVPAILIDEIAGREAAARLGLEVSGTVGLLRKAANADAVDFESAMARLLETNFRISRSVVQQITRGK